MGERRRHALILARGSNPSLRKYRPLLAKIEQTLPRGAQLQIWNDLEIFDRDNLIYEIDAVALGHYGLYMLEVAPRAAHALSDVRKKAYL
ncbi:MAG TPA: hypothetical protein VH165_28895, partial [Kofleriaceae bacterium]|nr:hypothetical protein [Kofleriaceae bacterium]